MIIENPDLFKSWLTSILEPLCDADPAALAKYVYALVKKEKPLEELREGMLDQLDVFLQHETKPFVDMLFKSLETMEYLKQSENKELSQTQENDMEKENDGENHQDNSAPAEMSEEAPIENQSLQRSPGSLGSRTRVVMRGPKPVNTTMPTPRQPPLEQTLVKVLPLNELLEEPVDQPPKRRDRRGDLLREKDDRRRRRSRSWDRRTRARRPHRENQEDPRRFDKRRPQSRSPSPRGRYRNRSPPPVDRPLSRSRSRSPVPRDRERERVRPLRELERDRMSRDRDHLERVTRSRDRERSRDRSMSPVRDRNDNKDMYKRRCRDFDEQGFCLRGDLCQWDHGTDPVVVEDVSRVLPVPEYNPLTPDIWCGTPGYVPYPHHPHPPRELIPIPRIREMGPPPPVTLAAPPLRHAPPHKKNFDYNRLGPSRPPVSGLPANCSLEVKKVPRGLNDITHLNNHFSKFGKIVNIQVCFEGDPEAALITFSKHTEASVAYKSTEAVLSNRFIKVFWHNPNNENKQENQPPTVQKQALAANQHPTSQNKVLINKDNMKATADNKLLAEKAKEAETAKEQKKEPAKPTSTNNKISLTQVVEARKRAQALLEEQLQQQVLMINKLESGEVGDAQKPALMEAIKSTQEGIEKLRKQLVAYDKTIKQMQEETVTRSLSRLQLAQNKRPKTREEAQKEILDAELDMFTKQQEGQDVSELQKKIAILRQQMALQFAPHPVARRPMGRGGRFNPATRYVRGAVPAPKVFVNQSVDHRPTTLLISGFESDELDSLIAHFSQYGTVTGKDVNLAVPELVLQYAARAHAEQAMLRGKHYNDRTLSVTWVTNNKSYGAVGSNGASQLTEPQNGKEVQQQPQELAEDVLLRSDEEEEDEAEDERSWRR